MAASEDLNEKEFTKAQIASFIKISEKFSNFFGFKPLLHMCNTSGILNYPEAHFDMVRSGIGLYGFGNSEKEDKNFKPIATLKSIISQMHNIEKGETVGYNRAYKSDTLLKTATIPIGHAQCDHCCATPNQQRDKSQGNSDCPEKIRQPIASYAN